MGIIRFGTSNFLGILQKSLGGFCFTGLCHPFGGLRIITRHAITVGILQGKRFYCLLVASFCKHTLPMKERRGILYHRCAAIGIKGHKGLDACKVARFSMCCQHFYRFPLHVH